MVLYSQGKQNNTQNDRFHVDGPAATHSVQGQGSDARSQNPAGHAHGRQPVGLEIIKASSAIDVPRVDDNRRNPHVVLHQNLEPEDQVDPTSNMNIP